MQFRLAPIFFALVTAIGVSAQSLQIDTPTNVIQCLPQRITWSGGEGPYFVSVQPGGQPGAAAIVDFGQQDGTSLTWVVNIPAGTSIGLTIRDQTGTVANSAPFTVGSSSDTGCLSESLSLSEGGTATSNGGATATDASATTTGTATGTTSAVTRTTGTNGSATTSAAAEETENAAVRFAQIGSAGVVGAVIAAVLA